ncbi:MAG: gamma-glutamyl-gamma-aminobutyrate hydrolase family protein [Clostridia bacterium]|nr:gamma-glutamyl-gamma-aminobutyrate hydrolase family protein [Clostridia bacterium]
MDKPIVILTPSHEENGDSFCLKQSYVEACEEAGILPLVLPIGIEKETIRGILSSADGLFLTGGGDIDPCLYGEEKDERCGTPSHLRDKLELDAVEIALELGIPVLGICRGVQLMNVALGGTLYQHIDGHRQTGEYHEPHHKVTVSDVLEEIYPKTAYVNSFHHQVINKLADKLEVCAMSEDGFIEGVYIPGHRFFVGVQWHPERMVMTDGAARRLFCEFARHCTEYKLKEN